MATRYSEFQTTNEHTFSAPQRMPGYGGYCPGARYQYGETFGTGTAAFFHDYRQRHLSAWRGGDHRLAPFPAVYNEPSHIASTRDRSRARWMPRVNAYDLTISGQRQADMLEFDRKCQEHREWYRDRSNSCRPVFHVPTPLNQIATEEAARQWKAPSHALFSSQSTDGRLGPTDIPIAMQDGDLPSHRALQYSNRSHSGRTPGSARPKSGRLPDADARPMSTKRDRRMRDRVFENRVGYEI
ncbi:ciliary microtubule inner protein 2C-like [Sycon ciliatum]|uniref:ciliary microtubule inner protein 2C-like n=1 Tax=Sycon ciliatum TaxID=27933 RepID=UPI0020AC382F|eukprot:scpid81885/ scgid28323/ UPF0573 protein C2orf70 homolog B